MTAFAGGPAGLPSTWALCASRVSSAPARGCGPGAGRSCEVSSSTSYEEPQGGPGSRTWTSSRPVLSSTSSDGWLGRAVGRAPRRTGRGPAPGGRAGTTARVSSPRRRRRTTRCPSRRRRGPGGPRRTRRGAAPGARGAASAGPGSRPAGPAATARGPRTARTSRRRCSRRCCCRRWVRPVSSPAVSIGTPVETSSVVSRPRISRRRSARTDVVVGGALRRRSSSCGCGPSRPGCPRRWPRCACGRRTRGRAG